MSQLVIANASTKKYPEIKKEKPRTSGLHCMRQTGPDRNAAARRAIATTSGDVAAAKSIRDRALMQREASHP